MKKSDNASNALASATIVDVKMQSNIIKEMRQVIEAYSELKSIKTKEHSDFILLRDQIKKLENCTNNIMNLCFSNKCLLSVEE